MTWNWLISLYRHPQANSSLLSWPRAGKSLLHERKRGLCQRQSDNDDWSDNEKSSGFKRFLNKVVGGHEDVGGHENGFPEVLDTVGKQLERWNVRHRAIAFCDEIWKTGRRGKPYRVPARK